MQYKAIGIMSGSALDGLDIAYVSFSETAGKWDFEIQHAETFEYDPQWAEKLRSAINLSALDYQLLHVDYGHYIGQQVNSFMEKYDLQHRVDLISSHGHTTFHVPAKLMTGQIGAGETGLTVISDLRAIDMALGGQGAPIVPMGEKLLFPSHSIFLNLGGIANVSVDTSSSYIAFDVCAANRVLNMLAQNEGKDYDEDGKLAAAGSLDETLLSKLNALEYYGQAYPKSLANDFGTDTVYPMLAETNVKDALRTYVEHVAMQITSSVRKVREENSLQSQQTKMLVTGGGAFNKFLIERLSDHLSTISVQVDRPDDTIIKFKEALVMALLGVRRWREETTVLASVTGAKRDSIGGAMWIGK
jgi:anhydro-N-acetylmuramic acid kinase